MDNGLTHHPAIFQNTSIHLVIDDFGLPWFRGSDVCGVFGIDDEDVLTDVVCKRERLPYRTLQAMGDCYVRQHLAYTLQPTVPVDPDTWFITYGGVLSLCLDQPSPLSKPFCDWVFHTVLGLSHALDRNHPARRHKPSDMPVVYEIMECRWSDRHDLFDDLEWYEELVKTLEQRNQDVLEKTTRLQESCQARMASDEPSAINVSG